MLCTLHRGRRAVSAAIRDQRSDQLPTQRFQLGPDADVDTQGIADLPGHDRSGGLPHDSDDALVVLRELVLLHARFAAWDQHHRPAVHLPGYRATEARSSASFAVVPLGSHLGQLLGQVLFEFVQLGAPRGDPFQQLGIQHAQIVESR
ncbi:hypothetical protein ABZ622_39770 [Streptomyces sp. NPDC007164]|uniref:hypothetical protein n=1 Tax=Streptomyces sp. NPDC007164 TaxID=3156918 RepID=UPI0033F26915